MADELNKFFETVGETLSEQAKQEIVNAWENKVSSLREEISAEIREELVSRYERDKESMVEAMDSMLKDSLVSKINEIEDEKVKLQEQRANEAVSSREKTEEFLSTMNSILESEIQELQEDRKALLESAKDAEKAIAENLKIELEKLSNERKKLVEDRVEFKIRSRQELSDMKQKLIEETARISEEEIMEVLSAELNTLKDELREAKENHFGRKIFEAFAVDYMTSFFNENKEVKKFTAKIEEKDKEIEELKESLNEQRQMLNETKTAMREQRNKLERSKILNNLLSDIRGEKRELMEDLLSKEPTSQLHEAFEKFLPIVLEDKRNTNQRMLSESSSLKDKTTLREVTGNREIKSDEIVGDNAVNDILSRTKRLGVSMNTKNII